MGGGPVWDSNAFWKLVTYRPILSKFKGGPNTLYFINVFGVEFSFWSWPYKSLLHGSLTIIGFKITSAHLQCEELRRWWSRAGWRGGVACWGSSWRWTAPWKIIVSKTRHTLLWGPVSRVNTVFSMIYFWTSTHFMKYYLRYSPPTFSHSTAVLGPYSSLKIIKLSSVKTNCFHSNLICGREPTTLLASSGPIQDTFRPKKNFSLDLK